MAKEKPDEREKIEPQSEVEPKTPAQMTAEELQCEILRVQLETSALALEEAKARNVEFRTLARRRREANQQRMTELRQVRRARETTIQMCRHRSGGSPTNILKGGGIGSFSVLTIATMPDGITQLIQCQRCPLSMYTPEKRNRQLWFASYEEELTYFRKLVETSREFGIQHNETRGPTFMFKNEDGVPFIPERV
jgi:hypothetical protein